MHSVSPQFSMLPTAVVLCVQVGLTRSRPPTKNGLIINSFFIIIYSSVCWPVAGAVQVSFG